MTERVLGPTGSPRRRWTLLLPLVVAFALGLFYIAGAQAVHSEDPDLFELEGDATANLVSTKVGVLQSSISAADLSANVCQSVSNAIATPPFQAIIDFEKINVTAAVDGNFGGSCPAPNLKRTYTIQRAQASTTAASHSGGADVTKLVSSATGDGAGDDWSNLFPSGTSVNPSNFDGKTFVNDKIGTDGDNTYFTGGGSKDRNDVSQWQWQANDQAPDKNDIVNAFAAAYHIGSRHLLYFGADRYQVGGDAQMAFWFLAGETCLAGQPLPGGGTCPNTNPGKFVNPNTGAVATHTIGDILAVVNFNNGGAIGLAGVYRWNGTEPESVIQGNNADCTTIGANDDFCTVSNKSLLTFDPSGWHNLYKGKLGGSDVNYYQTSAFIEGGIDLSGVAGAATCFPTFIAETRSSSGPDTGLSLDSQLKDLAFGQFQQCGSSMTTTPKKGDGTAMDDADNDQLPDVSIGTGSVTVKDSAQITVNGISTWSGTLQFYLCGPIASGTCSGATGFHGVPIGSAIAVNQGTTQPILSAAATLTSVGRYCWRGFFDSSTAGVPDATDSSSGECFEVLPVTPTLSTTASADVTLGTAITDTATLSGTATQPGNAGPGDDEGNFKSINSAVGAAANGSITWSLKGPDDCDDAGLTLTGNGATVAGDGTYGPVSATPTAVGKYTFVASYSGSSPNTNGAGPSSCPPGANDGDEEVTVTGVATLQTRQRWLPNDAAQITGPSGSTLSGNVVFKLFNDGQCGDDSGTEQYSQTVSVTDATLSTGTANNRNVRTSNATFHVTANNDGSEWSWLVSYDDQNLNDPDDECETTTPAFTLTD